MELNRSFDLMLNFSISLSNPFSLLRENKANADFIFQLYPAQAVIKLWDQFEAVILDVREKLNSPTHLEGFEFLYRVAKEMHPGIISRSLV